MFMVSSMNANNISGGVIHGSLVSNELASITDKSIVVVDISDCLSSHERNVAFHEAGHVVTWNHLSQTSYKAEIDPEEPVTHGCGIAYLSKPTNQLPVREAVARSEKKVGFPTLSTWDPISASMVLVYQAGLLAEVIAAGNILDKNTLIISKGSGDTRRAVQMAGLNRTVAVQLACQRIGIRVLQQHWKSLDLIAATLQEHKTISGDVICHLMNGGCHVH